MKIFSKSTWRFVAASLLVCGSASLSLASPQLQIGILGGVYDVGTETIVTNADTFTVVALGHTDNNAQGIDVNEKHFLSIAVTPKQTQTNPGPDYGTFLLNGNLINVVADMTFGTPPLEATGNPLLGSHDIFETYFLEVEFFFDDGDTVADINTEDSPSTPLNVGDELYFVEFDFDISNLSTDIELHFDLYNTAVKNNGDITRGDFAPFSHDGGTVNELPPPPPPPNPQGDVPEPTSVLVWAGLAGLIGARRARTA